MAFKDILGHKAPIEFLQQLSRNNRVPGALLFVGNKGIGKAKVALEFAKLLNCQSAEAIENGEPCGKCASCLAIDQGTHPDVTFVDYLYQARLEVKKEYDSKGYQEELEKELAKQQQIKVDTVRNASAKSVQKASLGGWKVLIIDEAQSLTTQASNALLKFIEEPPAKTLWILISSKKSVMLPTILSRCQTVSFAPLSTDQVKQILSLQETPISFINLSAAFSGGSISGAYRADMAISLLQNADLGPKGCAAQGPSAVAMQLSRTLPIARQEAQAVLDVIIMALHKLWLKETDFKKQLSLQKKLTQISKYKNNIVRNVSPTLVLETALMSLDGINLQQLSQEAF